MTRQLGGGYVVRRSCKTDYEYKLPCASTGCHCDDVLEKTRERGMLQGGLHILSCSLIRLRWSPRELYELPIRYYSWYSIEKNITSLFRLFHSTVAGDSRKRQEK